MCVLISRYLMMCALFHALVVIAVCMCVCVCECVPFVIFILLNCCKIT